MSARPVSPTPPSMDLPAHLQIEYVNLVRIAHSPSELVFDFAQMLPGSASANISSRIVMSPIAAKLFYRALAENLSKYETAFGEIHVPGGSTLANHLFRAPEAPER
jgi:hypothetical protein